MQGPGEVRLEKSEGLATIRLDRPHKLNAFSNAMRAAFGECVASAAADDQVRLVLVVAEGSDFCTGADLADAPTDALAWRRRIQSAQAHHLAMVRMNKPVIAAVQGRAVGGGASLALAADILLMADDARLVFPFVKLGVVPDGGAAALLQAKAGVGTALDVLLSGGTIAAAEALRAGLTRRVVPASELRAASLALAGELLRLPPEALMLTKALCAQGWAHRLESVLAHESDAFALSTTTPGHQQALAAARESLARKRAA